MSAPRNIVAAVKHLNMTEELNFKFHLILINLNLNSHAWLLATILDNTNLV